MRTYVPLVSTLLATTALALVMGLIVNPRAAPAGTASLPALTPLPGAWSAPTPRPFDSIYAPSSPFAWTSSGPGGDAGDDGHEAERLTAITSRGLIQRDLDTGAALWRRDLGAAVCLTAGEPDTTSGETGVVVVEDGGDCRRVVAVDLTSGAIRWQRTLPERLLYEGTGVDVTSGVVTVVGYSDQAIRLDAADGTLDERTGAAPGAPEDPCSSDYATGRGLLVAVRACRSGDGGYADPPTITAVDTRTGREVARRTLPDAGDPQVVVSRSPLIVSVRQGADGAMYRLDGPGNTETAALALGRSVDDPETDIFAAMVGDVLVARFEGLDALVSIDPATGREVARRPIGATELVVGVRDDRVLTLDAGGLMSSGPGSGVLLSVDPTPGTPVEALGTMDASGFALATAGPVATVVGDTLVTTPSDPDRETLVALTLPTRGRPLPSPDDALPWAAGAVRPEAVLDVRNHVAARALRSLGIDRPALPPANGSYRYFGDGDDDFLSRSLYTGVFVQQPTTTEPTSLLDPEEGVRPVTAAESASATLRKSRDDHPGAVDVPGLGDEAWVAAGDDESPEVSRDEVLLMARSANVVVLVQAYIPDAGVGQPYLRRGARLVAADLLARAADLGG